jgi:competence protein ComEA
MFQKHSRTIAVLFVLSLFATASFAHGGAASSDQAATTKKKGSSDTAAKRTKRADLVDINAATKDELSALAGIGDAYSQKIIEGRPYNTKRDLLTRKILPQETYDQVKDKIIAHHAAATGEKKTKKASSAATPK